MTNKISTQVTIGVVVKTRATDPNIETRALKSHSDFRPLYLFRKLSLNSDGGVCEMRLAYAICILEDPGTADDDCVRDPDPQEENRSGGIRGASASNHGSVSQIWTGCQPAILAIRGDLCSRPRAATGKFQQRLYKTSAARLYAASSAVRCSLAVIDPNAVPSWDLMQRHLQYSE